MVLFERSSECAPSHALTLCAYVALISVCVHALPNQDKRAGMTNQRSLDKRLELAKMVKRESRKVENLKQVYITVRALKSTAQTLPNERDVFSTMGRVQCQQITASSMRTASLHCPPRPVTRDLFQNGAKWQVVEGLQPRAFILSSAANRENPVTFRTSKSFSDRKGTPPTSPSISSKSFSDKKRTPPTSPSIGVNSPRPSRVPSLA